VVDKLDWIHILELWVVLVLLWILNWYLNRYLLSLDVAILLFLKFHLFFLESWIEIAGRFKNRRFCLDFRELTVHIVFILRFRNEFLEGLIELILDCWEYTSSSLLAYRILFNRIDKVFIYKSLYWWLNRPIALPELVFNLSGLRLICLLEKGLWASFEPLLEDGSLFIEVVEHLPVLLRASIHLVFHLLLDLVLHHLLVMELPPLWYVNLRLNFQ
jgi:hypothetical protein